MPVPHSSPWLRFQSPLVEPGCVTGRASPHSRLRKRRTLSSGSLANRGADAELVDALHDALDVAPPASSNGRCA